MDVLTDTEMSDRCKNALQSPHNIWGTDGGMGDILMYGGCTDVWGCTDI